MKNKILNSVVGAHDSLENAVNYFHKELTNRAVTNFGTCTFSCTSGHNKFEFNLSNYSRMEKIGKEPKISRSIKMNFSYCQLPDQQVLLVFFFSEKKNDWVTSAVPLHEIDNPKVLDKFTEFLRGSVLKEKRKEFLKELEVFSSEK